MNKRKLLIIAILIFSISIIVGSTYAYYSITKDQGTNTVEIGAKTLALNFSDGPTINTSNLLPGATIVKTFSVENTGTETIFYGLALEDVVNELTRPQDLTLTLSSTNDGGIINETQYPNVDGTIVSYIMIPSGVTQEYTLTLQYKNETIDQSVDMNKQITGTVIAVDSEEAYNLAGIAFDKQGNLLTSGIVEVHSDIITAPINSDGTYILENVPVGVHEIYFKDEDENVVVEDNFTLVSNHEERVNEKTIVGATNKTIAIEVEIEDNVVKEIKQQSSIHGVTIEVNNGFAANSSLAIYDTRNGSTTITPENHYEYNETNGSSIVCTNEQSGTYENNILRINNVTADTTCTVSFTKTKQTVNFIVNNGTSSITETTVDYGNTISTTIIPENHYEYNETNGSSVVCTNEQSGTYENNILIINNVTADTTCTVTLTQIKYTLMATSETDKTKFRSDTYKQKIKNITIRNGINIPNNAVESWDISVEQNNGIIAYVVNNTTAGYYDLFIESNSNIIANEDMSYWFANINYVDNINGIEFIDVSNTTNMSNMFNYTGFNSTTFTLDLGDKFNTSKVTDMSYMFASVGYSNPNFTLNLGDKFDTSNVTNMWGMFTSAGYYSSNFTLDLGDKFDTSNVTNMKLMFYQTGYNSTNFTLDLGNNFDTSNVTDMSAMFYRTGYSSSSFKLTLNLRNKNLTSFFIIFLNAAYSSTAGGITVNYSSSVSSIIDQLIATKDQGKVSKGVLIP